jgi:uncharacterized membrane protein YgdD (TMEM256/DUF423 family)
MSGAGLHRLWLAAGALAGLGAVALSAWAAHGASARLDPARLAMLQNGITMQGWHALALLATGLWAGRRGGGHARLLHAAGAGFLLGILLFCGAVYAVSIGGVSLGGVAPVGGLLLMLGWLLLLVAALRR